MTSEFFKYILVYSLFLILLFFLGDISFAAPFTGEVFKLRQPDNTYVDVKIWGDEFYQRAESMDGYTLCYDPKTNWICYADLNSSGTDFVSTGIIYRGSSKSGSTPSKKLKLSKGLKLKRESILKKASERHSELFMGPDSNDCYNSFMSAQGSALVPTYVRAGNVTGITILVDFTDCKSSISREEISNMINQPGYTGFNNNGSVRDYFYDISLGKLTYTNEVLGFYTAKYPKSYYNEPVVGRPQELVLEALNYAEMSGFDFSKLTTSPTKMVLAVNILYAGDVGIWGQGLWPHAGSIGGFFADGVFVSNYELSAIGSSLKIGPFVHENCHMILGYPDLYDYDNDSKGVGGYCIMGATGGTNPQPPNPYLRTIISGWGTVTNLNMFPDNSQILLRSNSPDVYRYSSQFYPNEFFLIESVCKKGRWSSMPDEGLIIWHIDTRTRNNDSQDMTLESHYKVSVEQADGQFHLERNIDTGGFGDLFHRGFADAFNDWTLPDSRWWNGTSSGLDISDISGVGDFMTFTIHNQNFIFTKTPSPTNTPIYTPTPSEHVYRISGYISPEFNYQYCDQETGFKIELVDTGKYAYTDSNGYFEIPDVKESELDYMIKISKEGFLTRIIESAVVSDDVGIGSKNSPVNLWAGDFNQDNAINMIDIIETAKYFNSIFGDGRYCEKHDVNRDNAVNMLDIMIIARHFNKSSCDYPKY